jgi:integrase
MASFTISKSTVEKAPQGTHYDDKLTGFGVRVGASGSRAYFIEYRPGAGGRAVAKRRHSFATHGKPGPSGRLWTADLARAEALKLLGAVKGGHDPAGERTEERAAAARTVAAVCIEWLKRDQAGNRDVARVARIMERDVLPAIGRLPIEAVRKADVIRLIDAVADERPVHANRTLAHVRRLFNWSLGRDLIPFSPVAGIEKPTAERARERVLSDSELIAIWRAAERLGGPFGAGVQMLIATGARRTEIFGATRGELDLAAKCLRLPAERSKVGTGRTIALSPLALDVIRGLPTFAGGDYLLTMNGKRPYAAYSAGKVCLDRVLAELGEPVADWRLHDLRRSVATALQRLGVRLEAIEAVLGHVSGSRSGIVGTYQKHTFETEARAALELWADHLQRLLDPASAQVLPIRWRAR